MSEVFHTNGSSNFNDGYVELLINGQSKGRVSASGQTLGAFVKAQAQRYGIRTFSVYLDGDKADTAQSSEAISAGKVDIVAKDARGTDEPAAEQKPEEHKDEPSEEKKPAEAPAAA